MSQASDFRSKDRRQQLPTGAARPNGNPRFEGLARLAGSGVPKTEDLIGILLSSALSTRQSGCDALRPLWAEEAMHRAYTLVRLNDARARRVAWPCGGSGLAKCIARALALRFRELETDDERAVLRCDTALREVVANLGMLFGHPMSVACAASSDAVSLPAYQRRALVLTTAELVSNALLHGFQGRGAGRIKVNLTYRDTNRLCLQVADNGVGFIAGRPNLACGVAAGLAGLLESELTYDRVADWTIAEICIPAPVLRRGGDDDAQGGSPRLARDAVVVRI